MTKKEFAERCNKAMTDIYGSHLYYSGACNSLMCYFPASALTFFQDHFKPKNKNYDALWFGERTEKNAAKRLAAFCDFINLVVETKEYRKW